MNILLEKLHKDSTFTRTPVPGDCGPVHKDRLLARYRSCGGDE